MPGRDFLGGELSKRGQVLAALNLGLRIRVTPTAELFAHVVRHEQGPRVDAVLVLVFLRLRLAQFFGLI